MRSSLGGGGGRGVGGGPRQVGVDVLCQGRLEREGEGAEAALEGGAALPLVQLQVVGQGGPAAEGHGAQVAPEGTSARVHRHVLVQVAPVAGAVAALVAHPQAHPALPTVHATRTVPHTVLRLPNRCTERGRQERDTNWGLFTTTQILRRTLFFSFFRGWKATKRV